MSHLRRIILALALSASLAPAIAQVPAPVPALPDTERRTAYTISASTCTCNVNFALFGDSTDYWHWLEVWINGVRYDHDDATHGWTITVPGGTLGSVALPITNAVLTFTAAQTGTVQIVGARRPRRVSQFSENAGVPARALNQALTDIVAQNREVWDKTNDFTGRAILGQPGETFSVLPQAATRANTALGFGPTGNVQLFSPGPGTVALPVVSGNLPSFNGTTGFLHDSGIGTLNGGFVINPTSGTTNQGINITQSGPSSGTTTSEVDYNTITINNDGANVVANGVAGLKVNLNTGGANALGHRYGILSIANLAYPSSTTSADMIGSSGWAISNMTNGGTNTGAGAAGTLYGMYGVAHGFPGALNYFLMTGGEFAPLVDTGASTKHRWGVSITNGGNVKGSSTDAAIGIGSGVGLSWNTGILLHNISGGAPISTTGSVISTDGSANTIANGIDLSAWTITGSFIKGPGGTSIDGAGNVIVTDGTAVGVYSKSALFGHSVQIGTTSNHNFDFTTNGVLAGYFDTSQRLNLGSNGIGGGLLIMNGLTSGSVQQVVPAAAGSAVVTWGSATGTPAVTASGPLAINTSTGNIACATCGVTGSPLSQFAATTSAQLRGILSDESGTGLVYFQGGDIGTPSAGVGTNLTGTAASLTAGNATKLATARNIAITGSTGLTASGTAFDGSAAINLPLAGTLAVANGGTNYTGGAWTPYTATVTPTSGTITTQSSSSAYLQIGKFVAVRIQTTVSNIGTGAGPISIALPVASNGATGLFCAGRESGVSGKMQAGVMSNGSSGMNILNYDNSAPTFSNGVIFNFNCTYEST